MTGPPRGQAYAASKTGLIGLATSLQFEALKLKLDIKVSVLVPRADTQQIFIIRITISLVSVKFSIQ
jgi:NAD(P)-dependent dehydrogenase (short-subunit alcohol dehydrogenase family)